MTRLSPKKPSHANLLPPKVVCETDDFVVQVYWEKDRTKSNITYLKRTCPDCGYRHEPIGMSHYCPMCYLGRVGYEGLLDMKLEVKKW